MERLRQANILYDREGEAEYFQADTRPLVSGFFFEIVERHSYRGYDAANVLIRLAPQTRLALDSAPLGP